MKRIIIILIILAAAVGVFEYWQSGKIKIADFQNFNTGVLQDIKKQISTSGPLRSKIENLNSHLTAEGVVNFTNQQRQANGLQPLTVNEKLNQAAALKVKDMFAKQYFEHTSPSGAGPSDLANEVNYQYIAIGENLALGNFKDDQDLVQAWMNSPGHRANILDSKYLEIGVAVMKGIFDGKTTWLAVQEFGRPASDCPKVDSVLKERINSNISEIDSLEARIQQMKAEIESVQPKTNEEIKAYNQNVRQYNDLIKIYNNQIDTIKILQSEYNQQVNSYNTCLNN